MENKCRNIGDNENENSGQVLGILSEDTLNSRQSGQHNFGAEIRNLINVTEERIQN